MQILQQLQSCSTVLQIYPVFLPLLGKQISRLKPVQSHVIWVKLSTISNMKRILAMCCQTIISVWQNTTSKQRTSYTEVRKSIFKKSHEKLTFRKSAYLKLLTRSRNSCQEMSPSRNFVLKLESFVGITIAIGDWASITLLQIWTYMWDILS